jgi:SAM-dependent methyltransferase
VSAPSPRLVGRALGALAADGPTFIRLCSPSPSAEGIPDPGDDRVDLLVRAGICERKDGQIYPRLWVTLRAGRPYLMSLSPKDTGDDSVQDIWPETEAMLRRLAEAPPGTLLDVGTGSGIIAVEAALRGHRVTATDLIPDALELARWNAAMHGVDIELLLGHLFEPVCGRSFDLILTAPHYAPPHDLLRVETLRAGPAHVGATGSLVVATFLEHGPGEPAGVIASLLAPLAATARIDIRPIPAAIKRRWFTTPTPHPPHLSARHRYLVEIRPGGPPGLHAQDAAEAEIEREALVPLSRLIGAGARRAEVRATLDDKTSGAWDRNVLGEIGDAADLTALERLLGAVARGSVVLPTPIPFRLLDGCRWGERPCTRAHGAIVDTGGGVRPCSRGAAVGNITDSNQEFQARMQDLHRELVARRGCPTCSAGDVCSQCAFPFVVDEAHYCDLIRAHAAELPRLHALLSVLTQRWSGAVRSGELRAKLARGAPRVAARFRPHSEGASDPQIAAISERFAELGAMLLFVPGERAGIEIEGASWLYSLDIDPGLADLAELAIDGISREGLHAYAGHRRIGASRVDRLVLETHLWFQSLE